jgi:hypothetical protein
MEITIKTIDVNKNLSADYPTQYMAEYPGLNFQTPFFGAEMKIEFNPLSIQSSSPTDSIETYTCFYFNEEYIGSSTIEKNFLGKEFTINIEDKKYKGVFEDKKTNLILDK